MVDHDQQVFVGLHADDGPVEGYTLNLVAGNVEKLDLRQVGDCHPVATQRDPSDVEPSFLPGRELVYFHSELVLIGIAHKLFIEAVEVVLLAPEQQLRLHLPSISSPELDIGRNFLIFPGLDNKPIAVHVGETVLVEEVSCASQRRLRINLYQLICYSFLGGVLVVVDLLLLLLLVFVFQLNFLFVLLVVEVNDACVLLLDGLLPVLTVGPGVAVQCSVVAAADEGPNHGNDLIHGIILEHCQLLLSIHCPDVQVSAATGGQSAAGEGLYQVDGCGVAELCFLHLPPRRQLLHHLQGVGAGHVGLLVAGGVGEAALDVKARQFRCELGSEHLVRVSLSRNGIHQHSAILANRGHELVIGAEESVEDSAGVAGPALGFPVAGGVEQHRFLLLGGNADESASRRVLHIDNGPQRFIDHRSECLGSYGVLTDLPGGPADQELPALGVQGHPAEAMVRLQFKSVRAAAGEGSPGDQVIGAQTDYQGVVVEGDGVEVHVPLDMGRDAGEVVHSQRQNYNYKL